ncbi:MAG: DsbA family protein [Rickettsiales bacterium]
MTTSKNSGKLALFALVALIGGTAGFGYFSQTAHLSEDKKEVPDAKASKEQLAVLAPKPNDIIVGDTNALVTMVEYSSLSCPHCAHFHEKVLPDLTKNFITPGKVKYVIRHFPLNEPAIKGSVVVECAGQNGLKRENFIKVLFEMQSQWANGDSYIKDLRQIASVGGIDSAVFDGCMNDKDIETRILTMRKEAEETLHVSSTPTLFIEGKKYEGEPSVQGFSAALKAALPSAK